MGKIKSSSESVSLGPLVLQPEGTRLHFNADGSLVRIEPGSWFVCFVPAIDKQWWHPFFHPVNKHVFVMRPVGQKEWTLFEPWWTRLLTATITTKQAAQFFRWGARGDVLLVREAIPGQASQARGWMTCASLVSYLLGSPYWVLTPHSLYKKLLREPEVCRVDVSILLDHDFAELDAIESRVIKACDLCQGKRHKKRKGVAKSFCMKCGRDLDISE